MAHAGLLTPVHAWFRRRASKKSADPGPWPFGVDPRRPGAEGTNAIRGHLKSFGIKLGKVKASLFAKRVRELTENLPTLAFGLETLLTARERLSEEIELLETQILALASHDTACQRLMTIPGIGPIAAVTYTAVIDDPTRFQNAAQVDNYLGLAPRQYQSCDTDYKGRIAKTGDTNVSGVLTPSLINS